MDIFLMFLGAITIALINEVNFITILIIIRLT